MSNNPKGEREHILIVLLGAIGDVIRALPLVEAIKRAKPESKVDWLVEPKSQQIVKLNKYVDQVWVFERSNWIKALLTLIPKLREQRYSVTLDLQRHVKSGLLSYLSAAPRRIGFHSKDSKEFNWIFSTQRIELKGEQFSKLEHYLLFLDALAISRPAKLDFGLDLSRINIRPEIDIKDRSIGMVLGSSWNSKDWPISGYLEIAQNILTQSDDQIVLFGDASQSSNAAWLSAQLKSERVINLVARTTLAELALLVSRCKAMLGPDSGPGHLAGALNVPYIGLFGPTSAERNGVYASTHLALSSGTACSPCLRRECPGLDKVCMRLITPSGVWSKLREVL